MRWQPTAICALALAVTTASGAGLWAQDKQPSLTSELVLGALKTIAEDPKIVGRTLTAFGDDDGLPNLVAPTMGGHTWWKNIDTHKGWKVQQNIAFGNCRILDPNDYRFAWSGGPAEMEKVFAKMKTNGMVIYNPRGVPEVSVGKWTELGKVKGWTAEVNSLSKHARIRDENGRTVAIGHEESVAEFLKKVGGGGTSAYPIRTDKTIRGQDGKLLPAPGYKWVTAANDDLRTVWSPGMAHRDCPDVLSGEKEGNWVPARGYKWLNDKPGDLRVVKQ